jgi:LAO/AO transport system kinase
MSLLLIPPGAGDSLQASKKGIMEAADIIIVNKADGEQLPLAQRTKADYAGAIHFIRQKNKEWYTPVIMISSKKEEGIEQVEKHIREFHTTMLKNDNLLDKRKKQVLLGIYDQLSRITINDINKNTKIKEKCNNIRRTLDAGKSISIRKEAFSLFNDYINSHKA